MASTGLFLGAHITLASGWYTLKTAQIVIESGAAEGFKGT
jgi:hypothetical protein